MPSNYLASKYCLLQIFIVFLTRQYTHLLLIIKRPDHPLLDVTVVVIYLFIYLSIYLSIFFLGGGGWGHFITVTKASLVPTVYTNQYSFHGHP